MRFDTPLRARHETWSETDLDRRTPDAVREARPGAAWGERAAAAAVEYLSYGPPDAEGMIACEIPATYGSVEAEYAALRRGAAIIDAPHRGVVRLRGADRRDLLDRLLTQKLADLAAGDVRAAFRLERKGRVEADLLVVERGDETLLEVDVHQAGETAAALGRMVFMDDVEVADVTAEGHRVALHGPRARETWADLGTPAPWPDVGAVGTTIAGVEVVAARRDQTGVDGIELFMPRDGALPVWEALLAAGARPVGWHAYNIARIEAGTPLFNVDFGPTNLPQETGVLGDRVSFAKGCYPGQEVVARIQNLGRPKQMLVGLRPAEDLLPVAGGQVFLRTDDGGMGDQVGIVTSSTLSPMLGARPIAFAMIRSAAADEGTSLLVNAEGAQCEATVTGLRFWSAPTSGEQAPDEASTP